jgi:hypothetical protein
MTTFSKGLYLQGNFTKKSELITDMSETYTLHNNYYGTYSESYNKKTKGKLETPFNLTLGYDYLIDKNFEMGIGGTIWTGYNKEAELDIFKNYVFFIKSKAYLAEEDEMKLYLFGNVGINIIKLNEELIDSIASSYDEYSIKTEPGLYYGVGFGIMAYDQIFFEVKYEEFNATTKPNYTDIYSLYEYENYNIESNLKNKRVSFSIGVNFDFDKLYKREKEVPVDNKNNIQINNIINNKETEGNTKENIEKEDVNNRFINEEDYQEFLEFKEYKEFLEFKKNK